MLRDFTTDRLKELCADQREEGARADDQAREQPLDRRGDGLERAQDTLEQIVRLEQLEDLPMVKVIAYGSDPATCPVRLLRAWFERAEVREGRVFRAVDRHGGVGAGQLSAHAVAKIVKRAAQRAGLDPSSFSGHSLRAGFVTEAKKRGADDAANMDQSGHRSLEMLRRYHRRISCL